MCAKLHTAAASNNRGHASQLLARAMHINIFVLRSRPFRGESHNQRNANEEVATVQIG